MTAIFVFSGSQAFFNSVGDLKYLTALLQVVSNDEDGNLLASIKQLGLQDIK